MNLPPLKTVKEIWMELLELRSGIGGLHDTCREGMDKKSLEVLLTRADRVAFHLEETFRDSVAKEALKRIRQMDPKPPKKKH